MLREVFQQISGDSQQPIELKSSRHSQFYLENTEQNPLFKRFGLEDEVGIPRVLYTHSTTKVARNRFNLGNLLDAALLS